MPPDELEQLERTVFEMVVQALTDYRHQAVDIFREDTDQPRIILACIPNGELQDRYNPSADETIWLAGRNAPTLGEDFRVRLSYEKLAAKAS